eukprot:TRINITY_DN26036_c0_g1_i2.p1 TRINITY_DN26036_c0_g1~~TRINITY_DN26036_c0_g1_i2.p1  ORF type:complete len:164 (+),score=21.26 TRINITY_DN26036_c0_g1_i2:109-600(+)
MCIRDSNDPDVPDSLRGKRLSWTTRVGQTTRVDTVLGDWYMSKVNATALLDPLGDVGNLRSLVPQWPLEQDNAWFNGDGETGDQGKLSEYKEGCTFGQIWSAHPSVPEGPVRFIGLLNRDPKHPDPNQPIDTWFQSSCSSFWNEQDNWVDLSRLSRQANGIHY